MSRKTVVFAALSCLALVSAASPGWSAPGDLDRTFDGDGAVTIDVGQAVEGPGLSDYAQVVALQPDGKILLAGAVEVNNSPTADDWALVRLLEDGTLDDDFGDGGIVSTDLGASYEAAEDIVLQGGKIVVVGQRHGVTDATVAVRYDSEGAIDTDFGVDGIFSHTMPGSDFGHAATGHGDGFVIVGRYENPDQSSVIRRLTSDGSLDDGDGAEDPGFGDGGIVELDLGNGGFDEATDVVAQDDGKLIVGGTLNDGPQRDMYVLRLNEDGSLDDDGDGTGFSSDGIARVDWNEQSDVGNAVALGPDGSVYVGGSTSPSGSPRDVVIGRFTSAGDPDTSWSGDGKVRTSFPGPSDDGVYDLVVTPSGKLIAVSFGNGEGFKLARYLSNGKLDEGFGTNGRVIVPLSETGATGARSATLQDNGRIVVGGTVSDAGNSDFAVARLRVDKGASETTLAIEKGRDTVKATGKVKPNHAGEYVIVKLFKKKNGKFRIVEAHDDKLNAKSRYVSKFDRPNAGRCKIVARFPGDAHHLASRAVKRFSC